MKTPRRHQRAVLLGALLLTGIIAHASVSRADDYGAVTGDDAKTGSQIAAEAFMAKSDWKSAAPLLEAHLAGFPNDDLSAAELGHVYDKLGDQDMALYWLNYALFIAPRSLEGNLYLGEYYLGQKDRADAMARLKKLDDICIFGCPEYRILKRAVAQYGAQTP
jgi:tetratricopeptide (TPR) repeat protein